MFCFCCLLHSVTIHNQKRSKVTRYGPFGQRGPKYVLRWLNRVMQDHEARASDLNRKLIFSFFFAIFLIKATET